MSPTSTARSRSLRQSGTLLPILRDAATATIGLNVRSSGNLKLQRQREAAEIHRHAQKAGDNAEKRDDERHAAIVDRLIVGFCRSRSPDSRNYRRRYHSSPPAHDDHEYHLAGNRPLHPAIANSSPS